LFHRAAELREGIVGQSGHSREALYNILSAALSKRDEAKQDSEKARQPRSRLIEILNVPLRVRLRFRFACGLADSLVEHPEVSYSTAPLSKMPTMYDVKLISPAACKGLRVIADKTNAAETARGMKGAIGMDSSGSKNIYRARRGVKSATTPSGSI
jgi:hypothetical protein